MSNNHSWRGGSLFKMYFIWPIKPLQLKTKLLVQIYFLYWTSLGNLEEAETEPLQIRKPPIYMCIENYVVTAQRMSAGDLF